MPVSIQRSWSAIRALLAALVVVGLVAFVSTPSFAASPAPTVTAVTPNAGATAGGTTVTVTGSGFTGVTGVTVGGVAATSVATESSTQLIATVPAHAAGITDIRVTGALGTSAVALADRYTYQASPTITSVSRNFGTTAGGDTVTVNGTGFFGVTDVGVGLAGAQFTVVSSTTLTFTSPAQGAGVKDVRVTTPYGTTTVSSADQYTYEAAPAITGVVGQGANPAGVVAGGTVQLAGSGFLGATSVLFGGVSATGLVVNSNTLLTVKAPAHVAAKNVSVTVTSPIGTSDAIGYNYDAVPVVTSLSTNQGSAAGGGSVNVLINGSGFTDASGVLFGTVASTSVTVNSDSSITASIPPHAAGLVDIHVVLGDGSSAVTTADRFTYIAIPAVTSISPAAGSTAGGNTVTITGTSFTGVTAVHFGSVSATIVGTPTATKITVTAPFSAAGQLVDVTVSGPLGTSLPVTTDHYTYIEPPTVSSVSAAVGVTTGGGIVTVTGTNFSSVTKVTFGGVLGTSLVVQSATQLTVKTPAHAAGTVDVQVVTPYGTSTTGNPNDQFDYSAVPVITSLNSTQGSIDGGDSLRINGLNLQDVTGVKFGTTPATDIMILGPDIISVTVPAHAAGVVDVTLQVGAGTSAVVAADKYTFLAAPTITKITPATGSVDGGTTVTVTGTNFGATSSVTVGGNDATSVHVLSTTSLTFVTPAASASTQDVQVNDFGSSPIVTADHFTYMPDPVVESLSATAGVLGGANVITINGANFVGVSKVFFGTTAATKVTTTTPSKLTVTVPAHAASTVDITVLGTYGTSQTTPFDQYTYEPLPIISGVTPGAGAPAGLTPVTITGTNFFGTAKVEFATTLATNVVVVSSTKITATIPAHAAGTVDVRVIGQYGTSAVVAADHYLYQSSGSIAGTVSAGTSQVGIQVTAFNGNGDLVDTTFTNSSGAYALIGLGAGNYTLDFTPADSSYAPQWYGGAALKSSATPIPLLAGQVLTGKNVTLSASGEIHGRVTDGADGLTDINLLAYDADGMFAGSTTTDVNGGFDILGLSAGVYTLDAVPQTGTADAATYASTWNGNSLTQTGSTTVVVTAGAASAPQTIQLIAGGSISGTVTGADSVEVDVYDSTGDSVASAVSDNSGAYRVGGLATGVYKVRFVPLDGYDGFQWYDGMSGGAAAESDASGLSVTSGVELTDVNATLVTESGVIGSVTSSASGSGIPGVEVSAYDPDGSWVGGAVTDGDGVYSIFGLAEGDYTLSFTPTTDTFAPQWWNGASTQATASPLAVQPLFPSEADAALTPTASISGTVLGSGSTIVPVAGATVIAYDLAGNEIERTTTDTFGNYSLSGLQSGSYKLDFLPGDSPFGAKWWNGATAAATANVITLTDGEDAAGTNITLTGASISGAVTGTGGVPLSGVRVYVVDAAGNGIVQATTNSIGHYALTGVTPGTYTLEFVPPLGSDYATQWLTGKPTETGATFFTVGAGVAVSGKNVALASTDGSISGAVTDASDSLPIGFVDVYAYDAAGNFVGESQTDDSGDYTLGGLSGGTYKVFASDGSSPDDYIVQWYGDKTSEATATPIVVPAGTAVTGKDVVLVANAKISGTVFDTDGTTGLMNVEVDAVNTSGGVANSTTTNPDGSYTITGLAAGSYALHFSTFDTSFAPQWYSNQSTFATANRVTVATSSVTTGVNVTMTHGATVSGVVSVPMPVLNDTIGVAAFDSTGDYVGTWSVDSEGNYTVTNLAAGTYRLDFTPTAENTTWWYGQSPYGAQLVVTVGANQTLTEPTVVLTVDGTITGTVTDAGGNPLGGVAVTLQDSASGQDVQYLEGTNGSGEFQFTSVPDGTYVLVFDGSAMGYVGQTEGPFTLSPGSRAPVENIELALGASISGTVFGADNPGVGLGGVHVIAEDQDGNFVSDTYSDPDDGTYMLPPLPAGSYQLVFQPGEVGYQDATITGLFVGPGGSLTGENPTLAVSEASISGIVDGEGASVSPVTNVSIFVLDSDGNVVGTALTGGDGSYEVNSLADGTYTIEFVPDGGPYEPTWWKSASGQGDATPVTLAPGQVLTGISPLLAQGATISGSVFTAGAPNQVAPFVDVDVYDALGNQVDTVNTNAVGQYTTDGLAPGKYTLDFLAPYGGVASYVDQWLGGASSESAATMITVLGAQQVTGQNAVLAKAGSISGTVLDTSGHALDGITVPVWMLVGGSYVPLTSTSTDGNGNYSLSGLGAGSYKIGFSDYASGDGSSNTTFGNQYWNAAPTLGSATPIALTAGQAATGKNATMTKISALANLTATPAPTIKGTAKSAAVLTATAGAWAPATVVLTYQWSRDGVAISGATATTYKLTAADVGHHITLVVTGQKVGYKTVSKTSTATALVSG